MPQSAAPAHDGKPVHDARTRALEPLAAGLVLLLCFSWGFNYVAVKLAIPDIPPMTQAAVRSAGACVLVFLWCRLRGIPLFMRDGTLKAGLLCGVYFAVEFLLVYQGLQYTTAIRAVVFLYMTPFMVVLGSRIVLPSDRFSGAQWAGLLMSFAGMVLAFGLPTPALDPRQLLGDLMSVAAAVFWAITILTIKVTPLARASAEKTMLYQLVVSAPIMAACAWLMGETMAPALSAVAIVSMLYQTVWVVSITYVIWFFLVAHYSANRLSAFTFLTPLFGVAAGHFVLGEPMTPAFAAAVALVAGGLVLVNRK
jgi:drug/metabolite transporter (DMT)-like permease